jgi:tripartite-type tricarboxylate transporter receptor subunit TctC
METLKGTSMGWNIVAPIAAAVLCLGSLAAHAQPYPSRPVKIVVPFAPGGNLDVTARLIGESLGKQLGQPFVVENRAGAGGVVGSEAVAKSAPDGYTLVMATSATTIVSPLLTGKPPYGLSSFVPVGMVAVSPLLLEVPAASPHADFRAFVAYSKANPGKVSIAHSGNGTTNHVAILLLREALKVDWLIVPYKGSGPALIDLVGGRVDSMVDQTTSSLPQIQAGKLRALAVGTRSRIAELPNVPTMQESGLRDYEAVTPSGLLGPAGMPADVVKTLNGAINKALSDPAVVKRLGELGSEPRPMSAADFDGFLRGEETKLAALVKAGVLKAD